MTKLALDGGNPVRSRPYPPWPVFLSQDTEAATSVLRVGKVNYRTGETSLAFLVHPTIDDSDVQDMIDAIEKVMTFASSD